MKQCIQCGGDIEGSDWTCPRCGFQPRMEGGILSFYDGETEGYAEEFFDNLRKAPENHFWFAHRRALISWGISKYCADEGSYLEIGCGNGDIPRKLVRDHPSLDVTASDSLWNGLRHLASAPEAMKLLHLDARKLPFEKHFDIVAAYDVIEHIDDDRSALREFARAVRPGGTILLTVPQHMFLWSAIDEYSGHERRYSRRELADKAREVGIEPVFITSFVSVLLPVMWAVRRKKREKFDSPTDEMSISAVANSVLSVLMAFERLLIRLGISLPAGGSLFFIGRVKG